MSSKDTQQNIRVAVRCRPSNKQELEKGVRTCVECSQNKVTVKEKGVSKVFTFDHVFNQFSKQIDVYKSMVAPIIGEIIAGYNCTIFAYGPTGSGKTFTMTGGRSDQLRYSWEGDPLAGIIPRAVSHLFETLQSNGSDFSVRVSFLEVYNEELFDLLSATEDVSHLSVYDDLNRKGSVIIKGLREVMVLDKNDVHSVIERGLARRQTAATLLNAQSSRSHSIFTVTVHIKETNLVTNEELLRIGKLHLVDLAGSENVGRSGAVEKRAREAGSINQSLLTLGRVITALVERAPHIPYRESKLTRLLQDSLGGRTKTSIIATVSPSMTSLEETLSTLDYAHRAKNIENRPEINARLNKTDLVRSYNEELERLRRDLEAARTKNGIFVDEDNYQTLQSQLAEQRVRICELEERREILEEEISQVQELFTVTQEELSVTRMRKEEVENELVAYRRDLESMRARFLKLKQRYEETEYLRQEHKKTELRLHEQANSLLSTADSAIGDMNGLHQKLVRLSDLDKENRERVDTLHNAWLPDRLALTVSDISALAMDVKDFCYFVRDSASDLREELKVSACNTMKVQREMMQKLRSFLADECTDDAKEIKAFSDRQASEAKTGRESVIIPQMKALQELVTFLSDSADSLNQCLNAQLAAYKKSDEELDCTIKQLDQFASLSAGFVASEIEHDNEMQKQMDYCKAQYVELLKGMESMMNKVKNLTINQDVISQQLSSRSSRLETFSECSRSEVERLKSSLFNTRGGILDRVCKAHDSNVLSVNGFIDGVKTISCKHEKLKVGVDDCFDSMCRSVEHFSTDGLGRDLLRRASTWQSQGEDHGDSQACGLTRNIERCVEGDLFTSVERQTAALLSLEAAGDKLFEDSTESFEKVETDLRVIPVEMGDVLRGKYQIYVPTGVTPQSRRFSYPRELAKTGSYRRILKEYRSNRTVEDNNGMTSISILDENLSFSTDFNESTFVDDQITAEQPKVNGDGNGDEDSNSNSLSTGVPDCGIVAEVGVGAKVQNSTQQAAVTSCEGDKANKSIADPLVNCKKKSKIINKKRRSRR